MSRGLVGLIRKRTLEKAFHPNAAQRVPLVDPRLFVCVRTALDGSETIVTIANCSSEALRFEAAADLLGVNFDRYLDLLSKIRIEAREGRLELDVQPYGIHWLKAIRTG